MKKTKYTLRRVPDEQAYFEPTIDCFPQVEEKRAFITGNREYNSIGDEDYIDIVNGDFYDDNLGYDYDPMDELKKVTGKEWKSVTIRGYSQGDWQTLYYIEDSVTSDEIEEIEMHYFGKLSEYYLEDEDGDNYCLYIPHNIEWQGKKAICEYSELNPDETRVLVDDGYTKEYKYKEIED